MKNSTNAFLPIEEKDRALEPAVTVNEKVNNILRSFEAYVEEVVDCSLKEVKSLCDLKLRKVSRQIVEEERRIRALEEEDRQDPGLKLIYNEVQWFSDQLSFLKSLSNTTTRSANEHKSKALVLKKENEALTLKLKNMQKELLQDRRKVKKVRKPSDLKTTRAPSTLETQESLSNDCSRIKLEIQKTKHLNKIERQRQFSLNDRYRSIGNFFDNCLTAYLSDKNKACSGIHGKSGDKIVEYLHEKKMEERQRNRELMRESNRKYMQYLYGDKTMSDRIREAVLPKKNSKVPSFNEVFRKNLLSGFVI